MYKRAPIQLELPLEWHINKVYPVRESVVRKPSELIEQIISKVECQFARKVFYIILSKDHLSDPHTHTYQVRFLDIYSGKKNVKERGIKFKEKIRASFQETSFAIDPNFVRVHLKRPAKEPYVSPFSLVDFYRGAYEITLTREFKLYLHVLRKEYKIYRFTRGDLNLLLSFNHTATDKLYWIIRKEQYLKGTIEKEIGELKELLGYQQSDTRSFCDQVIPAIKRELEGTWAEFSFEKIKKRGRIKSILFKFDKDPVLINKLKNDLRFEFEISLLKRGVKVEYIHNIRHLIANSDTIEIDGDKYEWTSEYVLTTIQIVDRLRAIGKVNDVPKFLFKALFEGYYIKEAHRMSIGRHNHGLFGRQVVNGITLPAKACTKEYLRDVAKSMGYTLEEYRNKLFKEKGVLLHEYKDYRNGNVYMVEEKYVKRLHEVELKYALSKRPFPHITQQSSK